jgi:hypothetical protein
MLCNGGLPDIDAELDKFAMNQWRAPQWVGETHLANEMTDFQRGSLDGHRAVLISSANTLGSQHDANGSRSPAWRSQSVQHARCQPIQPGKYKTVDAAEDESLRLFTSQHVKLMTKRQDLYLQRRSRPISANQIRLQTSLINQSIARFDFASWVEFPTMTGSFVQPAESKRNKALSPLIWAVSRVVS